MRPNTLVWAFILSFTLWASFSISSAFLRTSSDRTFSFDLSDGIFEFHGQLEELVGIGFEQGVPLQVGFLGHLASQALLGLVYVTTALGGCPGICGGGGLGVCFCPLLEIANSRQMESAQMRGWSRTVSSETGVPVLESMTLAGLVGKVGGRS